MNYFKHETAIIDNNVKIGLGSKIWHWVHISENAKIGKNCILGQNVFIGKNVKIGNNVKIQNNVSIYEGVTVEDDVFLGPSCVFTNDLMPKINKENSWTITKTLIKRGASIGANATIVCGNIIGEDALVGAGSVVTKDVQSKTIVVGNPAKYLRSF